MAPSRRSPGTDHDTVDVIVPAVGVPDRGVGFPMVRTTGLVFEAAAAEPDGTGAPPETRPGRWSGWRRPGHDVEVRLR